MLNRKIQNIFSEVPKTYERVNHVLTFGMDIFWRRKAARIASYGGGKRWLDVCSGTGEMAAYLVRCASEEVQIFAVDFTLPMICEAQRKSEASQIRFTLADVKLLPFPDETFDLITISFATRNINLSRDILILTFKEFYRILKPGGRFVNLETSQPKNSFVRFCFHQYIRFFVQQVGSRFSKSKTSYAYLASTIPRFYGADSLFTILEEAGFQKIQYRSLFFGATAIHIGKKRQ